MKSNLWDTRWEFADTGGEKLGQGGQGVVRRVVSRTDGTVGALKKLINYKNPERRKRMHIEAASLMVLDHPNICRFLDADTTSEGQLYLVSEYIRGPTLEEQVDKQNLTLPQAYSLSMAILSALAHAHSVGVFHRDIKPDNILIRDGDVSDPVLIDFGISFNEEENLFSAATLLGQQLGNRFLHLPELHRGARDPRSDLTQFSGVLLYALSGVRPVSLVDESGNHPHQQTEVRRYLEKSIGSNTVRNRLLRLFDKAFQIPLDSRWQTASELSIVLEEIMTQDGDDPDKPGLELVKEALENDPSKNRKL